ncbi:hypothetical protein AK812_SmicGene23458 [Symbiodinium microadriaticum]|uniref:Uncharacterized protein n=1 Tax=Symbiodinium microadriaticum TaxID=2951 RepID=A0A1Q9DHA0_SYMMI|nr:hypothetical protein AK812_SmicGene23458 [Symbiodinium microadriaticum]CAE7350386.1 unnamed protein product [Symbiodinium microadriaticum]
MHCRPAVVDCFQKEHRRIEKGAKGLGSASAQKLWKNKTDDSEPRPLQIEYNSGLSEEDNEIFEDLGLPGHQKVAETVFEDPEEAGIRPRLLVPLQSVLGLKALCEREYIRTETVTEMLNQCRTAYYKELLYLREQLILAAEPEKQMLLASVQNYEVYYFNPPAYVDEDLKEYIMNCSRWTHKKLIEENYELQMKLAGQEDVFENVDFCLKGLLRRHGTYKVFKTMHNIVKNAKDLFNPEDMIRKKEMEGLKPIDELQAAVVELFPNLKAKEDNSGLLLAEIEELQQSVTQLRAELAKTKDLLEKERNRANELNRKCDEQKQLLEKPRADEVEVVKTVDNEATLEELKQLKELRQEMEQEAEAQARRLRKQLDEFAAAKSLPSGSSKADPKKHLQKLDEAISDAERLFQAAASLSAQQVVTKVQGATKQVVDKSGEEKALKELQQLRQELEALKAKLAAAEKREREALQKLKELQTRPDKVEKSDSAGPVPEDYEEIKTRLERKIARIAELEAELDQTKRDLRAANRKVEEQELLLQEKGRKDAEKAKQLSDLMEKLRKSEEEADNLGGKLYNAQEKIKKLKEEIRDLKNKLGIKVEESEGEEEEEAEDAPSFMSRYAIRAKNSGKPRWMLLSEDAKLKSQKTEHIQNQAHQHVGSSFQAANALQFLRRAPSSPESRKPRGVRLQYGDTQEWYTPDASMGYGYGYGMGDGTPATPAPGGFSRQGSFQMGQTFTDGSAASPGGPRLLTSQGSMTFSGDASPQRSMTQSFSRQGTASMAGLGMRSSGSPMMGNSVMGNPMMGGPMMGSPTIGGNSRQGTPPLVHALGMPGSGIGFTGKPGALVAAGPASSAGPSGGLPARGMANPTGPQLFGQRQGTPPGMPKESLAGPRIASSTSGLVGESMGVVRFEAVPGMHSTPLAQGTGSSSLSVFGLSGPASPTSPSGFGADGAMPTAAAGSAGPGASPLRLPPGAADDIRSSSSMALSADGRHPGFRHANSASMSPSSFRLHHVGLASGGSSPTDAPLELIPQDYYGPRQASSPSRRGPLQPLRQNSSAAMSMPLNPGIGGDASLTLPDDAMVPRRLVMDPASQSGMRLSMEEIEEAYATLEDYIIFQVMGDSNEALGYAVGKINKFYHCEDTGAHIELTYLGCENEFYRWYIEHEGEPGTQPLEDEVMDVEEEDDECVPEVTKQKKKRGRGRRDAAGPLEARLDGLRSRLQEKVAQALRKALTPRHRGSERELIEEDRLREMRTLALGLDMILRGKADQVAFEISESASQSPDRAPAIKPPLERHRRYGKGVIVWSTDEDPLKERPEGNFSELIRARQVDYTGDAVLKALPLRPEELAPGLPEDGVAGSLDALALADSEVGRWVRDPMQALLSPEFWPRPLPSASMNVTHSEWERIVVVLYREGIIEPIALEDIFHVGNHPVLNGVFAVEKSGNPPRVRNG